MTAATRLTLRADAPALPLDLRGLTPNALAALDGGAAAVERLTIACGARPIALAEAFHVERRAADAPSLTFVGTGVHHHAIGFALDGGALVVDGDAGDAVGVGMTAGRLEVRGRVGDQLGAEMAGGRIDVAGDCGAFAASALPGSMDGMRGGAIVVRGAAGDRLADRMRRGEVVVLGAAGDFACARMVAGTVVVGGTLGAHPALLMRRGTLLALGSGDAFDPGPTFADARMPVPVFWTLLARSLERHGGALAGLTARGLRRRWIGDLAADGRGEVIAA